MSFPASLPSYTITAGSETLNGAGGGTGLSGLLNAFETDLVGLGTKMGTGSSTPSAGKVLRANGSGTSVWGAVDLTADVTGALPVVNGGTGGTTSTGTGAVVLASSPTIVTPTVASFTNAQHNHSNAAGGGLLNGANAITDGTITPAELDASAASTWVLQSWVPTLGNMSGGTLNYAKYVQIGKTIFWRFKYTLAGAGISGAATFTLPVAANSDLTADTDNFIGNAAYIDSGTQLYRGSVIISSSTVAVFRLWTVSGANIIGTGSLGSTTPFTWGAADYLIASGNYDIA